ncbi:MAG: hypothetical protein JXA60_08965 [Candidatus Coatesbacteria bacterium]|nr:hypothetical protein [Candidatus Coatesbacteria bacterium]
MEEFENRTELKVGFKKLAPKRAEFSVGYLFYQPERDTVLLKKGVMGLVVQTASSAPTSEDHSQILINSIKENYYKTAFTIPTEEAIKQAVAQSIHDFYINQTKTEISFSLSLVVITKDVAYFLRKYSGMVITQRLDNIRIQGLSQSEESEDPKTLIEENLIVTFEKMKGGDKYLIATEDTSNWLSHEKLRDFLKTQPPQVVTDELVLLIRPNCEYGFSALVVQVDNVEELNLSYSSQHRDLGEFIRRYGHYMLIITLIGIVIIFLLLRSFLPSSGKQNRYSTEKIIPSITETPRIARDSLAKVPDDAEDKTQADSTNLPITKNNNNLLKQNAFQISSEQVDDAFRKGKSTLKKDKKKVNPERISYIRVLLYHAINDQMILSAESKKGEFLPYSSKNKSILIPEDHLMTDFFSIIVCLPDGEEKYKYFLNSSEEEFELSKFLKKKKSKLKKVRVLIYKPEKAGRSLLRWDTGVINVSETKSIPLTSSGEFQRIEADKSKLYIQLGGYTRESASAKIAISAKVSILPAEEKQ